MKTEKIICDDVISREAVINHICESKECYKDECKGRLYKRCYDLQWIYDLPSVTPQPKTGRWIDIDVICEYIKEKANKKELHNRKGVCNVEVVGFVRGLRWTICYLKSLKGRDNK